MLRQITRFSRSIKMACVVGALSVAMQGQSTLYSIGLPTQTTTIPVEHGFIDIANGNLHLEFPFAAHRLRGGLVVKSAMIYDSSIWEGGYGSDGSKQWVPTNVPGGMGGWRYVNNLDTIKDIVSYGTTVASSSCSNDAGSDVYNSGPFFYSEWNGTTHYFPVQTTQIVDPIQGCTDPNHPVVDHGSAYATDGSGFYIVVSNYTTAKVYDSQGNQVATRSTDPSVHPYEDPNGNYEDDDGLDDLGRQLVTEATNGNTNTYGVLIESGQRAYYTVTTETINVYTHFISDSIGTDYRGPITVVSSIGLPDGRSYHFSYEQPDSDGRSEGELTGIVLPNGGTVSYSYLSGLSGTRAGVDVPARWVAKHIGGDGETDLSIIPVSPNCSGFACSISQDTYVTHNGITTDYAYNLDPGRGGLFNVAIASFPVALTATYGAPSATIEATATPTQVAYTKYTAGTPCPSYLCSAPSSYIYTVPQSLLTIYQDSGKAKFAVLEYSSQTLNAAGKADTIKYWDYYTTSTTPYQGSAPTGTASREEDITYGYNVNGALLPTVISTKGLPSIASPSGLISYQTISYDEAGYITGIAGITHHDSVSGPRGLATSRRTYRNQTEVTNNSPSMVSHSYYHDTGSLIKNVDPNSNAATYGYDPTDTFVTSVSQPTTSGVSHQTSATYDIAGQILSAVNENGGITSYEYDDIGRVHSITLPNQNQEVFSYSPTTNQNSVTESQSSGVAVTSTSTVDAFGRFSTGSNGAITYATSYDAAGRVHCSVTPASGTASTDGSTCYSYDPFNRITQITQPDNNNITVSYSDNTAFITDELGHVKHQTYDGAGNLIEVDEQDASGNPTWATNYAYDALNRLVGIVQKGGSTDSSQWRQRSFNYDFVRLLNESLPETNRTFDSYDPNGNLLSYTDGAGLNTQYQYDALNRLIKKTLSSGAVYTYTFDGVDASGDPFPIGQMSSVSSQNGVGTHFKHDISGNLVSESYCLPSDCSYTKTAQAGYDYHGNLTSLTYPDGRQVTSHYDLNDRPTDAVYATWNGQQVNIPYISQMTYYPTGLVNTALYGNGVAMSVGANSRQDITSIQYTLNSNVLLSKTYNWAANGANLQSIVDAKTGVTRSFTYDYENRLTGAQDAVGAGGSGPGGSQSGSVTVAGREQAVSKTICVIRNGRRVCTPTTVYDTGTVNVTIGSVTESVAYGGASTATTVAAAIADAFNGAPSTPVSATASASTVTFVAAANGGGSDLGLSVSVTGSDPTDFPTPSFSASGSGSSLQGTTGSLLSEAYTLDPWGNLQQSGNFSFVQSYNVSNQPTAAGIAYFLNGNLQSDGLGGSYTYDSESHLLTANGASYIYDPLGNRVRKDGAGSTEYYYFGGRLLATRDVGSGSWTDYIYAGQRLIAENEGTQSAAATFRLGDNLDSLSQTTDGVGNVLGQNDYTPYGQLFNNSAASRILFTGHEHDPETNSDYTMYRQLSMAQGRWMSPDPSDASYNIADPQSLNRYAYLSNRPLSSTDPLGLFGEGGGAGPCIPCLILAVGLDLSQYFGGLEAINEHYGQVVGLNDDSQGAVSGTPAQPDTAAPLDTDDLVIWGNDPGSFGESLGIPTGTQFNAGGVLGALGLPGPGCEFGACGGGPMGFTDYNQPQTSSQLRVAYNEVTSGRLAGLFNIKNHSCGECKYDYGWNSHSGDTWNICGQILNADQMGNFMAGYQAGVYDSYYFWTTGAIWAQGSVDAAGILYHLTGRTKATSDPLDRTGMPDILRGQRYARHGCSAM